MRTIVNISLPVELSAEVEREVRSGRYGSKSEFFRHLLRLWQEEQVLRDLRLSQAEATGGRSKRLVSLKKLR